MVNWFPIRNDLVNDPDFRKCSPLEKLYFISLISEFNQRGPFYKPDVWFAYVLKASVSKIRKARRKFKQLGWIEYTPGQLKQDRRFATSYQSVKWATVPAKGENVFFAQVHRFTFKDLLSRFRTGYTKWVKSTQDQRRTEIRRIEFPHRDLVTWLCLAYGYWRNRGKKEDHGFFFTKKELTELTGLRDSLASIKRLYEFQFPSGDHLFEFTDAYHKILFTKWTTMGDPSQGINMERNEEIDQAIENGVKELSKKGASKGHQRGIEGPSK